MNSYETIVDLLNHEGPGLQDYITPAELDQLINGTLAPAIIADRYLEDLADSPYTTTADEADNRAELLDWIRYEIDAAIQQRKEDAEQAAVDALSDLAHDEKLWLADNHRRKLDAIAAAQQNGATKDAIARNLGISRPTLDAWIRDREDRILFNDALAALAKTGAAPKELIDQLYGALGIRDTKSQAVTLLEGAANISLATLNSDRRALVNRATSRARELT